MKPAVWLLECAVDSELGQVGRDRLVEVQSADRDGLHDCRGCEQLRHRLDAEDGVGGDRSAALALPVAEALDPQRPIAIDERDGQPRYSLLGHELRDPLSEPGDDGRRRAGGRGWWRRPERNDRGGQPKEARRNGPPHGSAQPA